MGHLAHPLLKADPCGERESASAAASVSSSPWLGEPVRVVSPQALRGKERERLRALFVTFQASFPSPDDSAASERFFIALASCCGPDWQHTRAESEFSPASSSPTLDTFESVFQLRSRRVLSMLHYLQTLQQAKDLHSANPLEVLVAEEEGWE